MRRKNPMTAAEGALITLGVLFIGLPLAFLVTGEALTGLAAGQLGQTGLTPGSPSGTTLLGMGDLFGKNNLRRASLKNRGKLLGKKRGTRGMYGLGAAVMPTTGGREDDAMGSLYGRGMGALHNGQVPRGFGAVLYNEDGTDTWKDYAEQHINPYTGRPWSSEVCNPRPRRG